MIDYHVMRIVKTMTAAQRLKMLRDVIQNMSERNDAEEIARFLHAQCGCDDLPIALAYSERDKQE